MSVLLLYKPLFMELFIYIVSPYSAIL
jgi:hypothetical protein